MYQNKIVMKTTVKIFAFLLLVASVTGCSKGGVFPRTYKVLLSFTDAEGNDILKDIPNNKLGGHLVYLDENSWAGEILPELYKLAVVMPEYSYQYNTPNTHNQLGLSVNGLGDSHYLLLGESSSPLKSNIEIITHKLVCPYIFNDDNQHIIVTYWQPNQNVHESWILEDGTSAINECYRITVDGKEYPVTQEKYANATISTTRIILD